MPKPNGGVPADKDIQKEAPPDTNAPDTEENEESEEDTTEESEQDGGSNQDNDSEEGDDKGSKDSKKLLFMDPKNMPKELKPHFARMQATFTRKMQQIAPAVKKIEAWDNLVRIPEFRSWMDQYEKGTLGTDNGDKGKSDKGKKVDLSDADSVKEMIRDIVRGEVGPVSRRVEDKETKEEFDNFITKYPFHETYHTGMKEVMAQNPDLSFEHALAIASFDDLMEMLGSDMRNKFEMKKKGNINKPNKGGPSKNGPDKQSANIEDAFLLAKKQLGMK